MQPPAAAAQEQQENGADDSAPAVGGAARLRKMAEMSGKLPAVAPEIERTKKEQREAILKMSDPGHVPLPEAGRTWVNGDGQLGKWVHEHFAEIFQPKEEAYHHAVTARAVQGMKKVLVELEELNKRTQGDSRDRPRPPLRMGPSQ
jgi:hypothetical protein